MRLRMGKGKVVVGEGADSKAQSTEREKESKGGGNILILFSQIFPQPNPPSGAWLHRRDKFSEVKEY
ncbi:hypothetical protein L6164_027906 [Bauhinia variegata]|uniref:Uncharacterized protein n=1 Tax=Bauhinia variegata TaxID=167791 RepID=A0ACB9LVS9_BAUVA|nr:hypothetical protein L6164_027906 [Bauhinia variegata]